MESARVYEARILVVDDERSNLDVVERLLRRAGYSAVSCVFDPLAAEAEYVAFRPDILMLDLHMPGLGGFGLLARLRDRLEREQVPVLVLTGDPSPGMVRQALSSGAKDFVAKPYEAVELLLRVQNLLETRFAQLALREQNDVLEQRVRDRTAELANAELATLQLLARVAEFRDDETGRHTQRVGAIAALLAERIGCNAGEIELIRIAAPLHDIGKIGIPDHILLKPGPLTDAERMVMQQHSVIGAEILSATDFPILRAAGEIALSHHERWDGTGYPRRLLADEAPQFARIVAVADVFDALLHDRPYRPGLDLSVVVDRILEEAGRQLDPEVVYAFRQLADDGIFEERLA